MLPSPVFRPSARRLLPFDLVFGGVLAGVWLATFGLPTGGASLLATVVIALTAHLATWLGLLAATLVARAQPALTELDDDALLERDRQLDVAPMRASTGYGVSFIVLHAVLAAGSFGGAGGIELGARELIASAAMAIAAAMLALTFVFPLLRSELAESRAQLAVELERRGLVERRTPAPIAPHLGLAASMLVAMPVVYALGISLGLDAGAPLPERAAALLAAYTLLVVGLVLGIARVLRSMNDILFGGLDTLVGRIETMASTASFAELAPLPIPNPDELGRASATLNRTLAQLRELADAASAASEGDLRQRVAGDGQLQVAFRTMVRNFAEMVTQIRDTAVEVARAGAELHGATESQELAVVHQVDGIGAASRALVELSKAAADISTAAAAVESDAERTVARADQVVAHIHELGDHIARVHELLELIREVAERSDILALNGALEAVRAGETGRGFGLVAAEMRRLAERVTQAVSDVRELIADIDASTAVTVDATRQSRALVEGTRDAMSQIVEVTRAQDSQTKQVSSSVVEVREIIEQSLSATMQTRSTADQLRGQAEQLERLIEHFNPGERAGSGADLA